MFLFGVGGNNGLDIIDLLSVSLCNTFYLFPFEVLSFLKITKNTKLDEKLQGAENFRAWKYKIMLILEEHDLEGYIKDEVKEPEGEKEKAKHKDMM